MFVFEFLGAVGPTAVFVPPAPTYDPLLFFNYITEGLFELLVVYKLSFDLFV